MAVVAGKTCMDRNAPDGLRDTAQTAYDDSKALLEAYHGKGRATYAITPRFSPTSTPDQLAALGIVFSAMDADAIMIIEAPDHNGRRATVPALENFAKAVGLRARKAAVGFENDTQQEIAVMYDPTKVSVEHRPFASSQAPRFDESL